MLSSRCNFKGAGHTLEYLFRFLDAYDFASEGKEELQKENRSLINASVLGKVFEKINGYKDGSIYTPGFITMYMCRQAIRLAVVNKFREETEFDGEDFDELRNWVGDRNHKKQDILRFNEIVDSLKICDPAVGSGHFLVSALNKILSIKSDLKILADSEGNRFTEYSIDIDNDELIITDRENNLFEYKIRDGKPLNHEMQRLQTALFHEKQKLIESCLFGVDINPNSVKICRLRLWIELLKNAYYKSEPRAIASGPSFCELETLPNIDINIKQGNSLISRYKMQDPFNSEAARKIIKEYRDYVWESKSVNNKARKDELRRLIRTRRNALASSLEDETTEIRRGLDKKYARLSEINHPKLFEKTSEAEREMMSRKVQKEIDALEKELRKVDSKYDDAFEWRFEYPEVLDDDGNFSGFDIVIGNPPYIRQESLGDLKNHLKVNYVVFYSTADIFTYFYELGVRLLRSKGRLSLITSNKYMRANFGRPLRKFLTGYSLADVIDFGDAPVFAGVTAYPSILNLSADRPRKNGRVRVFSFPDSSNLSDFEEVYGEKSFEIPQSQLSEEGWKLERAEVVKLLEKLSLNSRLLGEHVKKKVYFGIKTGLNEAFVLDRETRGRLISEDPECEDLLVSFLRGRNINRWKFASEDLYLIKIESSTNVKHPWSGLKPKAAETKFAETYPSIHRHLEPFREQLISRDDKGVYFWELRACAYWEEFRKPKILYPDIYLDQSFAWDQEGYFPGNTCYFIPTDDQWLMAILNSRVTRFFYSHTSMKMRGGYFRSFTEYIEQIPIPSTTSKSQSELHSLVHQVIDMAASNNDATELENRIDRMVYELYGLTAEDIAIVEGR